MFYYAQKAVLHPTAPLFAAESKKVCLINLYTVQLFMFGNRQQSLESVWEQN